MAYKKVDFELRKFKKFDGEFIENIIDYINGKVGKNSNVDVIVGCDSQQRRSHTVYALTIMFYDRMLHKGAHVIYMKIKIRKERDMFSRLMNESLYVLDLGNWLDDRLLDTINPKYGPNEYDGSFPYRKVQLHVDINPDYGKNKQNKSHLVYSSVMGMLCGSGFSVHAKPDSSAASSAADSILRK